MASIIYGLCALTSALCAWLLLQAYGRNRYRLLFWSGLFFIVSTVNNVFLMVDKLAYPAVDFSVMRYGVSLMALGVLLRGLVFEAE